MNLTTAGGNSVVTAPAPDSCCVSLCITGDARSDDLCEQSFINACGYSWEGPFYTGCGIAVGGIALGAIQNQDFGILILEVFPLTFMGVVGHCTRTRQWKWVYNPILTTLSVGLTVGGTVAVVKMKPYGPWLLGASLLPTIAIAYRSYISRPPILETGSMQCSKSQLRSICRRHSPCIAFTCLTLMSQVLAALAALEIQQKSWSHRSWTILAPLLPMTLSCCLARAGRYLGPVLYPRAPGSSLSALSS
jgi:hypothetical protein